MNEKNTQTDNFKQAARGLECDGGQARWYERLKKVAKGKPSEDSDD